MGTRLVNNGTTNSAAVKLIIFVRNIPAKMKELSSLFSPTFRPPPSVVFRAPDFQGSGVITLDSFFSHFSQTIDESARCVNEKLECFEPCFQKGETDCHQLQEVLKYDFISDAFNALQTEAFRDSTFNML
ncbi:conserved hypothetical protein [Trichinella spiralis]|uniref:hypothetical protein n=1 Tax=Trichinella spiralis TaxID=6334 RepID=UPI0001EFB605|nr:conserved hypothetical protein [Trichinella spiralis]